jgi:hypothetical protein
MPMMPLSAWVTVAGRGQPGISKASAGLKTAWRRVRHRARNAGRLGPLPLNALPCDFDDASSCRINHGKLGRSERLPGVDGRGILYGEAPGQIGRTGTIKLIEEENSRQTASNLSGQIGTPRAGAPNAILGNGAITDFRKAPGADCANFPRDQPRSGFHAVSFDLRGTSSPHGWRPT